MSHDRMRDVYYAPRSQSAGGRYQRSTRAEPSMENLAPMLMPSGLNSMLKNTTETGDIGMFSIKPTRLPRHNGGATLSSLPKAAYHDLAAQAPDFSLSKVRPRMDDRRRLPSYNRDVTSEIASLYETNSMKSSSTGSRLFDDPEQRSYSMTQTSVNVSRLANHRSYASLRSQGDIGAGQRPRSPFAYPTRLRRPGFRPSSPALTDGGVVDYSRRAEIGRESSVSTQLLYAPTKADKLQVASPSSTSTADSQRRMPAPLSLRTDVNRSTPIPGGSVPPSPRQRGLHALTGSNAGRHSPSPSLNMPQSPLQREFYASRCPSLGRKSPAPLSYAGPSSAPSPSRSVVSNAPIVPSRLRSRASSSATAEKVPTSPLYYDYTESFYPEDEVEVSPMEEVHSPLPGPPFMIDRTIHEDRELSSDWSYLAMTDLRGRGFLASEGLNLMVEETPDKNHDQEMDFSYAGATRTSPLRSVQVQSGYAADGGSSERSMATQVHAGDTSSLMNGSTRQLPGYDGSGYGSGSTEPTPLDEVIDPNEDVSFVSPTFLFSPSDSISSSTQRPVLASSVAGSVYYDAKPNSESFVSHAGGGKIAGVATSRGQAQTEPEQRISQSVSVSVPVFTTPVPADDGKFSPQTVGLALSTAEHSEVRETEAMDEDVFADTNEEEQYNTRRFVQTDFPLARSGSYQYDGSFQMDPKFKLNKYKSDSDLAIPKFGIRENNRYTIEGSKGNNLHIGPRNPREFCFRSASEIVSPIPISPARELRVKNSIPQFMKALPPLPLRQPVAERIPLADPRKSTSKRPPPLKLDSVTMSPGSNGVSVVQNPTTPILLPMKESPKVQRQFVNSSQPFLSRWRLKPRSPTVVPKPSPPASRPWNLEDSYPWNSDVPLVEPLPIIVHKKSGVFAPKLRLKMMKSSESLRGTVRVNRNAAQGSKDIPTLGQPKDLFSSPSFGLTNMFRQVSHHLQGSAENAASAIPPHPEVLLAHEEAKAKWNHKLPKSASKSTMIQKETTAFDLTRSAQQANTENGGIIPRLKQTVSRDLRIATNIALRSEARPGSLRHEGSQQELHDSIRKKFRARLPMSHSTAQSRKSEDRTGRPNTTATSAPFFIAGLDGANDFIPPAPPIGRSKRLKKKVSSWLKGAKTTVMCLGRRKHATEASVN